MAKEDMREGDTEHVSNLRDRLMQVANEIDTIKNSFSKGTEDLSRIQNMLDIGGLEEITGIIENFEKRVTEAEKEREEASQGAQRFSDELEKEKERLVKLWDAYKNQEEELSNIEKKLTEYEEKVRTTGVSNKQLEDDFNARIETLNKKIKENEEKANRFEEYKQRCEEYEDVCNKLEEKIHGLKQEIKTKDDAISSIEKKLEGAEEAEKYAEYKDKFEEVSEQFEKEKERLTKLYHLYEETEAECNKLRDQMKGWQDWYNSNKDIFNRLFSAAPPVTSVSGKRKAMMLEPPTSMNPETSEFTPENPTEEKNSKKNKKKGLFRK